MTVLVPFSSGELEKHPKPQRSNFVDRRLSQSKPNQILMQMQDIGLWVSLSLMRL